MKRHRLMNDENPSQKVADACNNVHLNDHHVFLDTLSPKSSINIKKNEIQLAPYFNKHSLICKCQSYNENGNYLLTSDNHYLGSTICFI
jgi:hypothetical protein